MDWLPKYILSRVGGDSDYRGFISGRRRGI